MNKDLDKYLMDKHGFLYRDRSLPMTETCMCWGFDVDDGWFDILEKLGDGISGLLELVTEEEREQFCVEQVKEKFGSLRYYFTAPDKLHQAISALVRVAEADSRATCELCGKRGEIRSGGWLKCLCDGCREASRQGE